MYTLLIILFLFDRISTNDCISYSANIRSHYVADPYMELLDELFFNLDYLLFWLFLLYLFVLFLMVCYSTSLMVYLSISSMEIVHTQTRVSIPPENMSSPEMLIVRMGPLCTLRYDTHVNYLKTQMYPFQQPAITKSEMEVTVMKVTPLNIGRLILNEEYTRVSAMYYQQHKCCIPHDINYSPLFFILTSHISLIFQHPVYIMLILPSTRCYCQSINCMDASYKLFIPYNSTILWLLDCTI